MGANHLLVVGGGTMGADIAASFAVFGWEITVVNPPDRWAETFAHRFETACRRLGHPGVSAPALIKTLADVSWAHIDLVIEAAPEDLGLKRNIFAELSRRARKDTPLCSNSSALPISRIGEGLAGEERMMGAHYFMPAHLIPGVEVVRSVKTADDAVARVCRWLTGVNKVPIVVKRDLPGFLVNRIQHAVSREAMKLIDRGIATPEDIDAAVRFGFGFRYLAAGPCLQRDHAGLDVHFAAAQSIYPDLCNDDNPSRILSERVNEGALGMKTGRGFYEWTPETMTAEKERYEGLLASAVELLQQEISARRTR